MKNKEVKGILALIVVTALSFGVIIGSKNLAISAGSDTGSQSAEALEELDVNGAENIEKASKTSDGYLVTVRTKGYVGDIVMDVAFDESASKITSVQVVEQAETDGLGSKIAEAEFLDQFKGVEAPVYLPGMDVSTGTDSTEAEAAPEESEDLSVLEGASLADGTYEAKTEAPDSNGFTDVVTLTVKDGAITEANWDAVTEDGSKKSIMSENGEYTMTEDGLTWKEQAEKLASALIENQSLTFLNTDAEGKTDAVSGVSISVNSFIDLAAQCMKQAAGLETAPADPFAGAVLTDGTYEATTEAPDSNGFTDVVTLTVKDGAITEASWDAVTEDGSKKSIMSENGEYTMTEDGLTWKEQAEALASALIENQSLSFLNTDAEGKTDAVSGVSISVNGFIDLAAQCMKQAAGLETAPADPFAGASLTDGTYEAKTEAPDSNGFTDVVTLTVKDGAITEASWDAVTEDGSKKSIMSENGEYTMTEDGLTWKEQAEALASALIENQSLSFLNTDAEGKTDAVSGVSISVNGFIDLATKCLEEASGIQASQPETEEATEEETASEETSDMAGTEIDAVSGATMSSTAAVTGINEAYDFLQTVK